MSAVRIGPGPDDFIECSECGSYVAMGCRCDCRDQMESDEPEHDNKCTCPDCISRLWSADEQPYPSRA